MDILDEVFSVIARLRTAELRLLSAENTLKAERIRERMREVSDARDRLIVLELAEAEGKLRNAEKHIGEANSLLREYLSDSLKADARLEMALEAVSKVIMFLRGVSR